MEQNGNDWVTTREAAVRLGLAPREVYRLIDRGELAAHSAGRDLRLRAGDVDALASARPPPER